MSGEFGIAIHALVYLSRVEKMTSSEQLAISTRTNPARVRKVMARLKAAELVGAKEGATGGYYMVKRAESITLDMLLDALGIDFFVPRARTVYAEHPEVPCAVAPGMDEVFLMLCRQLNDTCKARLTDFTIADIDGLLMELPVAL